MGVKQHMKEKHATVAADWPQDEKILTPKDEVNPRPSLQVQRIPVVKVGQLNHGVMTSAANRGPKIQKESTHVKIPGWLPFDEPPFDLVTRDK